MFKYFLLFISIVINYTLVTADQLTAEGEQRIGDDYIHYTKAEIIILNKITSKSSKRIVELNKEEVFGTLFLNLNKCVVDTSNNNFKTSMSLTIIDNADYNRNTIIFDGWLFPDNLSINSFEHSVFEIIPLRCL